MDCVILLTLGEAAAEGRLGYVRREPLHQVNQVQWEGHLKRALHPVNQVQAGEGRQEGLQPSKPGVNGGGKDGEE